MPAVFSTPPGCVPRAAPGQRGALPLDRGLASPRLARDLVARTCRAAGIGQERCEVAVLLTSEVVTNAVVHGSGRRRLEVVSGGADVRVEVADGSSAPPGLRRVGPHAVGGRGVALLEALADAWGVDPTAEGKVVWFELGA